MSTTPPCVSCAERQPLQVLPFSCSTPPAPRYNLTPASAPIPARAALTPAVLAQSTPAIAVRAPSPQPGRPPPSPQARPPKATHRPPMLGPRQRMPCPKCVKPLARAGPEPHIRSSHPQRHLRRRPNPSFRPCQRVRPSGPPWPLALGVAPPSQPPSPKPAARARGPGESTPVSRAPPHPHPAQGSPTRDLAAPRGDGLPVGMARSEQGGASVGRLAGRGALARATPGGPLPPTTQKRETYLAGGPVGGEGFGEEGLGGFPARGAPRHGARCGSG